MSENKIEIPTSQEAKDRVIAGKADPIDQFVYIIQPSIDEESICIFRKRLENALQYAIDSQGSFRLTPDAPESAVGDSSPINKTYLNDPGGIYCPDHPEIEMIVYCPVEGCDQPRPKTTTKPENRTPSPTPSFR